MSGLPRTVACYKRTLDHLKSWSFKLPNHLRIASVNFNDTDRTHDGLRLFTYQHIPQLKFHNPDVKFLVATGRSSDCTIEFIGNGEENSTLDLKGKSHREIKDLIEQFYPQIQADLLPDYN